ncbi:MAG: spore coat protein CotJB [Symbiobacteriia bacterium]
MTGAVQAKAQGYYEALAALQANTFGLVELNLYLDTHPGDADAVAQYAQLSAKHDQMLKQFEDQYGPITYSGIKGGAPWGWAVTPWPWEV